MKNQNIKSQYIRNTINHIKRLYPRATNVDISTKIGPRGYETKIEVLAPRNRMFAVKSESTYKKSMDRSIHAIVRQIHKAKAKLKKRRVDKIDTDELDDLIDSDAV